MRVIAIFAVALGLGGCASIKPYEKEYLLQPAMDDGRLAKLNPTLMPAAASSFERLSSIGGASGGATSCPTCGG